MAKSIIDTSQIEGPIGGAGAESRFSIDERLLRKRKQEAQKDDVKNLKILREIRDDSNSKASERLAAISKIDEIGFDKTPSREPEKDISDKKVILLGIPTLDMLKRVAKSTVDNPSGA